MKIISGSDQGRKRSIALDVQRATPRHSRNSSVDVSHAPIQPDMTPMNPVISVVGGLPRVEKMPELTTSISSTSTASIPYSQGPRLDRMNSISGRSVSIYSDDLDALSLVHERPSFIDRVQKSMALRTPSLRSTVSETSVYD